MRGAGRSGLNEEVAVDSLFICRLDLEYFDIESDGRLHAAVNAERDSGIEPLGPRWITDVGKDSDECPSGRE
jgi:hypothetical protein